MERVDVTCEHLDANIMIHMPHMTQLTHMHMKDHIHQDGDIALENITDQEKRMAEDPRVDTLQESLALVDMHEEVRIKEDHRPETVQENHPLLDMDQEIWIIEDRRQ